MTDYFACPNCGAEVPAKAKACPECGSDENTGWSEDTVYDGLGLHEDDEIANARPLSTSLFQNRYFVYLVVILTLLVFLWIYVLK